MKRRSKFNAEQYIDNNYVENEEAIISIYIEEIDDFYNEFDADDLTITDDIINFINSRVENISTKYSITLEFDCPVIEKKERDKIANIIRSNYGLASSLRQKKLQSNKLKALIFFVIGSLFLLLSYSTTNYGSLIRDILSIAGWVAIWETVNAILLDNFKMRNNKYAVDRLYNAKIVFKERK